VDECALLRAIRARGIVNVVHQPTQLKGDFHVVGGTPLERVAPVLNPSRDASMGELRATAFQPASTP
jgi:hypothetical protein